MKRKYNFIQQNMKHFFRRETTLPYHHIDIYTSFLPLYRIHTTRKLLLRQSEKKHLLMIQVTSNERNKIFQYFFFISGFSRFL
jgi:hypothetical protein